MVVAGSKRLRRWRKRAEISQVQLSEILRVNQGTICRWERGSAVPGLKAAIAIARISEGEVPVESWSKSVRAAA